MSNLYASPYARLARRFAIVGLSALIAALFVKVSSANPLEFANGVLALSSGDWIELLKVFIGAGILAGIDKLKRELSNM